MPGMAREQVEHVELVARQLDLLAVHARVPARGIDGQALHRDRPRVVADRRCRAGERARAAQQRADARDELADAERLGQVVVGAALESEDLVGFLAPRREHEDRHVAVGRVAPDGAADGDAVESRQHQIEDHEIERLGARQAQPFVAVADRDGLQSLEREVQRDEVADVGLVLDHQHPRARRVGPALVRFHVISVAAARAGLRVRSAGCHRFFTAPPQARHGTIVLTRQS